MLHLQWLEKNIAKQTKFKKYVYNSTFISYFVIDFLRVVVRQRKKYCLSTKKLIFTWLKKLKKTLEIIASDLKDKFGIMYLNQLSYRIVQIYRNAKTMFT